MTPIYPLAANIRQIRHRCSIDGGFLCKFSISASLLGGFILKETVFTGDVNTLMDSGFYYVGSATNVPAPYCHLINLKNPNNQDRFQIAGKSASNEIYVRGSDGNTWPDWKKLALTT